MTMLTWVDWLIAVFMLVSVLISLRRGFFQEAISLLTWLAAIVLAWRFGNSAAVVLEGVIDSPSIRAMVMSTVLFFAVMAVGIVANRFFSRLVIMTGFTGTDRVLGVLFGGLRGILLLALLVSLAQLTPILQESAWKKSVLVPHILLMAEWSKEQLHMILGPAVEQRFNLSGLFQISR